MFSFLQVPFSFCVYRDLYASKDGRSSNSKTFEAVGWLAQLITHIPNRGEQMVKASSYPSLKNAANE